MLSAMVVPVGDEDDGSRRTAVASPVLLPPDEDLERGLLWLEPIHDRHQIRLRHDEQRHDAFRGAEHGQRRGGGAPCEHARGPAPRPSVGRSGAAVVGASVVVGARVGAGVRRLRMLLLPAPELVAAAALFWLCCCCRGGCIVVLSISLVVSSSCFYRLMGIVGCLFCTVWLATLPRRVMP